MTLFKVGPKTRRRAPLAVVMVGLCLSIAASAGAVVATPPPLGQDPAPGAACQFEANFRPDPGCSPGEVKADFPKELFCKSGYSAEPGVRNVPRSLRDEVLRAYGLSEPEFTGDMDHVVALSFGGTNGRDNLAPIPKSGQHGNSQKNTFERIVRDRVCERGSTLTVQWAQARFQTFVVDWGKSTEGLVTP